MGSDILQTISALVVEQLPIDMVTSNVDRQMLASSLGCKNGDAPTSGEITGILKTMEDEMKAVHQNSTEDDNKAEADYEKARGVLQEALNAQTASNVANEQELAKL